MATACTSATESPNLCSGLSVHIYVNVPAPCQAFGQRGRNTRHRAHGGFNLCRELVDGEVWSGDLDADGTLDAGGRDVDAVADRGHPYV